MRIPSLLSLMATGSPDGEVEGIDDLQNAAVEKYGEGDYEPYVPVTYWSFHLMIGFGVLAMLITGRVLGEIEDSPRAVLIGTPASSVPPSAHGQRPWKPPNVVGHAPRPLCRRA